MESQKISKKGYSGPERQWWVLTISSAVTRLLILCIRDDELRVLLGFLRMRQRQTAKNGKLDSWHLLLISFSFFYYAMGSVNYLYRSRRGLLIWRT